MNMRYHKIAQEFLRTILPHH